MKARAYHSQHEWKKKIKVAPPCAVPGAFPNTVEVFFSDCSANKILHPLHLRGLRILWSLWELHLFTKAFAWKLYKHRCTIKRGPYVTGVSPCCGPNVTIFTALSLKSSHRPIRSCGGQTVTYTIHTYIPSAFNSCLLTSGPITQCKGHNCAAWRAPFTTYTFNIQHVVIMQ